MKAITIFLIFFCINFILKSQGKFSALIFGDYYYNVIRDDSITKINGAVLKDEKDLNGFTYRRIYLTHDYNFNTKISSRFNLEAEDAIMSIKDAYLKFDSLISDITVQIGIMPVPVYCVSEKWWGNRFLEKTITDLRKYAAGRDIGVSVASSFFNRKLLYLLMVGNNSSNKLETDRFKSIYSQIVYKPSEILIFAMTFSYHFAKKIINIYDNVQPIEMLTNDKYLLTLFLGYNDDKRISTGIELFLNTHFNGLNLCNQNKFSNMYSCGGTFYFALKTSNLITLVERVDYYEPNSHYNFKNDRSIYNITGVNFNIGKNKNIIISLNIQYEFYDKLKSGYILKPSITPRITFYWKY